MRRADPKSINIRVPDMTREVALRDEGYAAVCGVDEVGRGPWAGPVVAAAVILDFNSVPEGLNDSKRLSELRREYMFHQIKNAAMCISIAAVPAEQVDVLNIRNATLLAMRRAVDGLAVQADYALVDGNASCPDMKCDSETLVKGDSRSCSIAAASIVAKVMRDTMMQNAERAWPEYGFSRHKGYGTAVHSLALEQHGPCPLHRFSFAPLKQYR